MSRLVPHGDMSATEIVQCSTDAMAIIALCENTAFDIAERGPNCTLAGNIADALKLALEVMGAVHDALKEHEGPIGEACEAFPNASADIIARMEEIHEQI